jgi:hypothetical protein
MTMPELPYSFRVYRLGLTRKLRAEIVQEGRVIARAEIAGEGPPDEAVALARQWAASIGYPTPEPAPRHTAHSRLARPLGASQASAESSFRPFRLDTDTDKDEPCEN